MKNYNSKCKLCELDMPHQHIDVDDLIPEFKSLTIEQIKSLWNKRIAEYGFYVSFSDYRKITKDIEKAHGIT